MRVARRLNRADLPLVGRSGLGAGICAGAVGALIRGESARKCGTAKSAAWPEVDRKTCVPVVSVPELSSVKN